MDIFTVECRVDIDNILKFNSESMLMAGVINKGTVISIIVDIYEDTKERVEIEVPIARSLRIKLLRW